MRRLAPVAAAALSLALAAPASAADQTVFARSNSVFDPASVTVNVDDTVTWRNDGGIHNVSFDDGSYTQPAQPNGTPWTVSRQFKAPGTFKYHCDFHGSSMSGTVVVQGAQQPPPPGGDTTPPDIDGLRIVPSTFCNRKTKTCKKTGARIEFTIDEDAKVSGRIVRRSDGKRVGSLSITATAGEGEFAFSGKGLKLGKYRLELTPRDAAGNKAAKPTRANFTIATKRR
ncbi:MAG TPA: plastocyanin/azurin family copper-binding protein [Thermoleophilaceae bacterium]|nr:plastocyanin/azurin family copper-binding protein [Thermoleophilaceae bacterium]